MLTALLDDEIVYSFRSEKGKKYICPECKCKVLLKKGDCKIHHFAHIPGSERECSREGMTEEHYYAQMFFFTEFWKNGFHVELESQKFGDRRPDVYGEYAGQKIVIEIQHSNIDKKEIYRRNAYYASQGCSVIWINTSDFYLKLLGDRDCEISLPDWRKYLLNVYGCLYVYHKGKLHAFSFKRASRDQEWNPKTGEYDDCESFELKNKYEKTCHTYVDFFSFWQFEGDNQQLLYGLDPEYGYAADWKYPSKDIDWDSIIR